MWTYKDLVRQQLFQTDDQGDDNNSEDLDPEKWLPEEEEIVFRYNFNEIVEDLKQGQSPKVTCHVRGCSRVS